MENNVLWTLFIASICLLTICSGQNSGCVPVKSERCNKYGFNETVYPNYVGQLSVKMADAQLGSIFKEIKFCNISRSQAEMIGCAIYVPLCSNNKRIPPCSEDCEDVIQSCKINEIPGFEMALTLCGIFPIRSSGGCITHGELLTARTTTDQVQESTFVDNTNIWV